MSSNRSEALPLALAEAVERSRGRLGRLATRIVYFPSVGSTNDVAVTLAEGGGLEGAVVIADTQTAGRGRRGRSWFSPPGSGLYVSIVLAPGRARPDPVRATALLTLAAGVAISEAIEAATGLRADIKWPNDLLVGRRKLAGILAEGTTARSAAESVVLGYGINVGAMAYPPELRSRATSIEAELGRGVDRPTLCVETLTAMARRYADLLEGRYDGILDAWRTRAPGQLGARVEWVSAAGRRAGVTAGVDDHGALLVRVGDGPEGLSRIVAGEVDWL